jgi:hypothetical protein
VIDSVKRGNAVLCFLAGENVASGESREAEISKGHSMTRPTAPELLETPGALLTRSHLRELGLERRVIDAVFRALPSSPSPATGGSSFGPTTTGRCSTSTPIETIGFGRRKVPQVSTALDTGQRSPRKFLRAVVARLDGKP